MRFRGFVCSFFILFAFVFHLAGLNAQEKRLRPIQQKKYKLSVCALIKNEERYLREWIEYHRMVGDAFYYVMAPALEVERKPSAQRTLDSTLRFAQRVALSSPLKECDFRIYLSVWLMRRVGEARFYGEVLELLERKWL